MALVGAVHRCVPRVATGAKAGGGLETPVASIKERRANNPKAGELGVHQMALATKAEDTSVGQVSSVKPPSVTYRYRDPQKRRVQVAKAVARWREKHPPPAVKRRGGRPRKAPIILAKPLA